MSDPALRLDIRPDGVGVLTFDQPNSRANILTRPLWEELHATLRGLPALTGLILTSAKPGIFIAGADLKFFANVPAPNDPQVKDLIEFGLATLELLETLPFPTCDAIDGAALGGGLEVALACDFRLAGTHAKVELGLPEVKLGLIPGWGGTQRLPRVVGLQPACEKLAGGESWTAGEAKAVGLVSDVVESEQLQDAALGTLTGDWHAARAGKRGGMSRAGFEAPVPSAPPAVREAMTLLNHGPELPLADALKLETAAFLRLAGSDDSRHRIAAFFAARKK